jgi:D-3-phosphoglycerate dehydrogenase / 2-oxoglutarate reductase
MAFKVALVAYEADPPDFVREALEREGLDFVAARCRTSEELKQHAADADVVWVFSTKHPLSAANLALLERCGGLIRTGSGTDNVPVEEATRRHIVVANTPDAVNLGVSDHTILLMLALGRKLLQNDASVRSGHWAPFEIFPDFQLAGRTVGLISFGRIARAVARKLSGFEPRIMVFDPFVPGEEMVKAGVQPASFEQVCTESDVLSVHCPLTSQTRHLMGEPQFRSMKRSALFINTSRGPVVDEPALIQALTEGWIAGAALDVLEQEPPSKNNPLFRLPNVVLTPHTAGFSASFWRDMWMLAVEAAIDFSRGHWPRSYVNPSVQPRFKLSPRPVDKARGQGSPRN